MIKTLRSLIQEKFPVELRVKIELLSKRRDITNKEKQDELFKLLREFEIENIVPLGPGTNRYAFKLDGFVIKVATDHDGKIDNLKEFKMAKRLYPYVTKTYEVSENGTLLVAEYIQPFSSYGEMLNYADKIREILTKLSSVYLIGDVGITSKNFANWGLRIGGTDPVCLDFAYVYEVSSELFICKSCKSGSMLVPNKDFTELYCPNKGCGQKYLFEDIRSKIGNDIHKHEIGDLTEEGYLLSESNVTTELTLGRSNYLARKARVNKKKVQPKEKEEIVLDNFVMEHEPSYYNGISTSKYFKEETRMANTELLQAAAADVAKRTLPTGGMVVRARARITNKPKTPVQPAKKVENEEVPTDEPVKESTLAFSGSMNDSPVVDEVPSVVPEVKESQPQIDVTPKVDNVAEKPSVVIKAKSTIHKKETAKKPAVVPVKENHEEECLTDSEENTSLFPDSFKTEAKNAFSIISNKVGTDLHIRAVFDEVKGNVRNKKMFPEQFYKGVQNAVFRSLMAFCNFSEMDVPNANGKGYHKEFTPPDQLEDTSYTPTMIFVSRLWADKNMGHIENPEEMMKAYRDKFSDYDGFQEEWLEIFKNRLNGKIQIDGSGLNKVAEAIANVWVAKFDIHEEETSNNNDPVEVSGSAAPVEEEQAPEDVTEPEETFETNPPVSAPADRHLPDISGSYYMNDESPVIKEESEFDEEGNYEEDEEGSQYLSVEIYPDDDMDVIKVKSGEAFGNVSIPFYTKLSDVDTSENVPSIADDRNGKWDWLIHMVPDMMFVTKTPDEWLTINTYPVEEEQAHIVIMNEDNGVYTMGIFFITGIWIVDEEGHGEQVTDDETLAKLNKVIREDIGYSRISHLQRSLQMTELIQPEEYIRECFVQTEEYEEEENMNSEEMMESQETEETNMNDLENAAIAALTGSSSAAPVEEEQAPEEITEPEETFETNPPVSTPAEDKYESMVNNDPKLAKYASGEAQTFAPIRRKNRANEK